MRLRSCSRANVSGVAVFGGGAAVAVAGGAEAASWSAGFAFGFADTEAGTKDIIVVAGLGAVAGGALAAGLPCL
jgi:hypothetical protein